MLRDEATERKPFDRMALLPVIVISYGVNVY
jgi:hypothetical protein